ncbi:MAG: F-box domain-containing protein [Gammaproteobacteria bacterium]|nr:F-box domain-containing protein [Gammaproteobacteria bacterium]
MATDEYSSRARAILDTADRQGLKLLAVTRDRMRRIAGAGSASQSDKRAVREQEKRLQARGSVPLLPAKPPPARKFKDLPPNVHRFIASKMSLRNATRLSAVNKTTRSAIADDVAARAAQRIKAVQRARGASADLLASKIRSKVIQLVNKLRQVNYIIPMDWALDRANDGRMRWVLGSEAVGRITVTETKTHTDTKRHILEVYLTGRFVPENNERQEDFDVGIRQYVSSIGGTTYRGTMFLRLKRNTDTNLFRVTARLTAHRVYESQVGQSVKKAATALNDVIPYEMQPR